MSQGDRSQRDWQFALRLANRGFTESMIVRDLRRGLGSQKTRDLLARKEARGEAYARTTARKAIAFVKANPAIRDTTAARARLLALQAAADRQPWAEIGAGPRKALQGFYV